MAGLRRLGMGLILMSLLASGCGRQATQLAAPATQTLTFSPVAGGSMTATSELIDMGNTIELRMTGSGFAQTGVYSLQPLRGYTAGTPATVVRSRDAMPEYVPVTSDGGINVVTSFQHRGGAATSSGGDRWVAIGVFYNANGDPGDERNAQLVMVSPLPSDL
jgi:hypothetical protein